MFNSNNRRGGTHPKPVTHAFIDYGFITVVKFKGKSILKVHFLMWSQRVVEKLSLIEMFGELLAPQFLDRI